MKNIAVDKATELMVKGIEHHRLFREKAAELKVAAANAGWFFMLAKEKVPHGDWMTFMGGFQHELSHTTAWRYMQFTEEIMRWAAEARPDLKTQEELLQIGVDLALKSPRGITAILRATGDMEKFGEYDPERYQEKKERTPEQQLEIQFTDTVRAVSRLVTWDWSLAKAEQLDTAERELFAALEKVREARQSLQIDV